MKRINRRTVDDGCTLVIFRILPWIVPRFHVTRYSRYVTETTYIGEIYLCYFNHVRENNHENKCILSKLSTTVKIFFVIIEYGTAASS